MAPPMELWGGRFSKAPDQLALEFGASIDVDRRLYQQDILGSMAHCRMLARQGIIPREDAERSSTGWSTCWPRSRPDAFEFRLDREDIHANVEGRLREQIGEPASKLHTARSRNDQVALDTRLWTREALIELAERIAALQEALLDQASANLDLAMPGYTHVQRAQPVLLAHHLHAYVEMLQRDAERLRDAYAARRRLAARRRRAGRVPVPDRPRDRSRASSASRGITRNSHGRGLDRDFAIEVLAAIALIAVHLSRLCEEIVLWTSTEFGFVDARRRLVDRLEHHAAEEERRLRRAGARQDRPRRSATWSRC